MSEAVIRYESRATTNGKPIGSVYVLQLDPRFGRGTYSYTKDPAAATSWPSVGIATQILRQHTWQEARAVLLTDAEILP